MSEETTPIIPLVPRDPDDELTQAALADPRDVTLEASEETSPPTLWRLIMVVAVAVAALAMVFWHNP